MKFTRLFEISAYILAYPMIFLVMNNSHRTRVIIHCQGELLILRARLNLGKWMLPGGGVKRDEEATVAATREVFEETGISVDPDMLKKVCDKTEISNSIKLKLTFYAVELPAKPSLHLHTIEIAEARWVTLSDLPKVPMPEYERDEVLRLISKS